VLVHATSTQADAIARAMKSVATGDSAVALSAVDVAAIEACHHVMLHRSEPLDVAALRPITPVELAGLVGGGGVGEHAVQFLAVIALVDGSDWCSGPSSEAGTCCGRVSCSSGGHSR
jgi:hypothetical protein